MSDQSSQNSTGRGKHRSARPRSVTEILATVLDPVLARRAGMRIDLVHAWSALAGPDYAETTAPEKITWPRRTGEDDPFKPGTLVVACEPSVAVFFEHETGTVLERVNTFFGFEAVERIRILQKPVRADAAVGNRARKRALAPEEARKLEALLGNIDDPELRTTLARLGSGIFSEK